MEQDKSSNSWPLVVGITAGVIGGIVAGVYLYSMHGNEQSSLKLPDAKELISQCQNKIKEIESGIEALKQI